MFLLLVVALTACASPIPPTTRTPDPIAPPSLALPTPAATQRLSTISAMTPEPSTTAETPSTPAAPPRATETAVPTLAATPQTTKATSPGTAPGTLDVTTSESTVTLDAYPYEQFWTDSRDPATNISFKAFDPSAFSAAQPKPQPKSFHALIVENEYLKLTFLPELGGRLYQVLFKPTGQTLLYNNPVLKPSPWGMSVQKGWLAAGGIEWAFPSQEHGYEWNTPWNAAVSRTEAGVSVTLTDSFASDRPRVRVRVTLPPHAAYFTIEPHVENATVYPQRLQFWDNAMLNLDSKKHIAPETEFIFPDDNVLVHSTANEWIPQASVPRGDAAAPHAPVSFSNLNGHDLRYFRAWDNYLGVFAVDSGAGKLAQNFVAAYNHKSELGIARVFPPAQAPGVKLFAFGPNFCCRDVYTDNDSGYFEMWGGIPRTFFPDDDVLFRPGESRTWKEYWLPLANTNGVSAAASDAALTVQGTATRTSVWVYSAIARDAVIVVKQNDEIVRRVQVALTPARVWSEQFPIAHGEIRVQLQDLHQNLIVETK